MFEWFKRNWHKAQALSVLQSAYRMPFKEPLDALVDIDLRTCIKLVMDAGGNPFDTAVSFMILRADNAIRVGKLGEEDTHFVNLMSASFQISRYTSLWSQHMLGITRLGEMMKAVKADIAANV
jgi:hypothetical protein